MWSNLSKLYEEETLACMFICCIFTIWQPFSKNNIFTWKKRLSKTSISSTVFFYMYWCKWLKKLHHILPHLWDGKKYFFPLAVGHRTSHRAISHLWISPLKPLGWVLGNQRHYRLRANVHDQRNTTKTKNKKVCWNISI